MSKNNQTLEVITIGQIDVSKTNPRKHFDEKALNELSESIKEHGILQPILVRPINSILDETVKKYELVCGERRYRAAILAELEEIPVNIRVLTDDEAFELQIVENLERKDVHPLDEADAFKKMIDSGKYTIADIAAKMAKAESFIAQRLKLVDLIDEVREDFIAGKLGIGHAILIARCNPTKQMSIYDDAKPWQGEGDPDYGTISELKEDIETDSCDLTDVKFDLEDSELVKECGACSVCPKRSGANPVLFADMQEDRCFDETCFNRKQEAYIEKEVAKIINDGDNVVLVAGWNKPSEMIITICKQFNMDIIAGGDWVEDNGRTSYNDNWQNEPVKAFCVSGGDEGEYKNVFLKKTVVLEKPNSSNTTGPLSNEELEVKEEIQKIQDRQKRALELDGEKVWEKIRATDKSEIKTKSNPLSQIELNALCFAMIDKLGYSGNSDVKKLVGDFNLDFARTGDFTNEQFNQISRIFYAEILPTAYGTQDNVVSNQAYYKVIKEYYDAHLSDIELEQKAIAEKRIARANEKIEALNAKIEKVKPAEDIDVVAEPTDPAIENPNLFEKVTKKYALNNSYFKNRHPKAPATPLEVAQYFRQYGDLPFDMDVDKNPNWLYDTYMEYQKKNSVYHSQFFTPPATAKRIAELAYEYFNNENALGTNYPVTDMCCGFGMLSKPLVDLGFKPRGYDFSVDMIELYKQYINSECEVFNYEENDNISQCFRVVANPPYEVPKLTKFFERLHSNILADNGKAIILLPKGFMLKEKPKALVEILEKFDIIHSEDMVEDFAHTKIKAEIIVLEKAQN